MYSVHAAATYTSRKKFLRLLFIMAVGRFILITIPFTHLSVIANALMTIRPKALANVFTVSVLETFYAYPSLSWISEVFQCFNNF